MLRLIKGGEADASEAESTPPDLLRVLQVALERAQGTCVVAVGTVVVTAEAVTVNALWTDEAHPGALLGGVKILEDYVLQRIKHEEAP